MVENPIKYYGTAPIQQLYDEMFAALDAVAWKIIYHYQVINGKKPVLIQFDEGIRSYTMDFELSDKRSFYEGTYGENSYSKAIKAIYLYRPELYAVENRDYELYKISNPYEIDELRKLLIEIFGAEDIPAEKYIYFEDHFFTDRFTTNDFELFKEVARTVGSENIVVKTHPRDDYNRFEMHGYKTIGNTNVPWEILVQKYSFLCPQQRYSHHILFLTKTYM